MKLKNSISNKGYIIVKNALNKKLIKEIQNKILKGNNKNSYTAFSKKISKIKNQKLFKFINPINKILFNENLIDKLLLEKKVISELRKLLGSDLAFSEGSSLFINKPERKKNYYFKSWHQEIWSGTSVSMIHLWTPIFQKNKKDGQISFIKDSHKWGHIPHRNRKVISLPKDYKIENLNVNIGDLVMFTGTTVHRTEPCTFPRLGLGIIVKNFKYKDYSFSQNLNWKIFSLSELSKLQKYLGNHYLSPYRLVNIDHKFEE